MKQPHRLAMGLKILTHEDEYNLVLVFSIEYSNSVP